MIGALASIAAAVIVYYLKRKLKKSDNEREQLKDTLHEIDSAIASGNESDINVMLDNALRLRDAGRRDSGGQDSNTG